MIRVWRLEELMQNKNPLIINIIHHSSSTKDYEILGSLDGQNWRLLVSATFADAENKTACSKPLVTHDLGNPSHYRFIKFAPKSQSGRFATLQYLGVF